MTKSQQTTEIGTFTWDLLHDAAFVDMGPLGGLIPLVGHASTAPHPNTLIEGSTIKCIITYYGVREAWLVSVLGVGVAA